MVSIQVETLIIWHREDVVYSVGKKMSCNWNASVTIILLYDQPILSELTPPCTTCIMHLGPPSTVSYFTWEVNHTVSWAYQTSELTAYYKMC